MMSFPDGDPHPAVRGAPGLEFLDSKQRSEHRLPEEKEDEHKALALASPSQ
jgi:hypothetical protein